MESIMDNDLEMAEEIREKRKQSKEKDFNKVINKKDLNGFELDELFMDEE